MYIFKNIIDTFVLLIVVVYRQWNDGRMMMMKEKTLQIYSESSISVVVTVILCVNSIVGTVSNIDIYRGNYDTIDDCLSSVYYIV